MLNYFNQSTNCNPNEGSLANPSAFSHTIHVYMIVWLTNFFVKVYFHMASAHHDDGVAFGFETMS